MIIVLDMSSPYPVSWLHVTFVKTMVSVSARGSLVRAASPPVSSREQRKYLDTDDILI